MRYACIPAHLINSYSLLSLRTFQTQPRFCKYLRGGLSRGFQPWSDFLTFTSAIQARVDVRLGHAASTDSDWLLSFGIFQPHPRFARSPEMTGLWPVCRSLACGDRMTILRDRSTIPLTNILMSSQLLCVHTVPFSLVTCRVPSA